MEQKLNSIVVERSCLLVIQRRFYSYERLIREALEAKGFRVTVANDEYPESTFGKIMGKLQVPLIFQITRQVFARRFLNGATYDLALIFKGRGMSPALIRDLRARAGRVIAYNWDSFGLNRSPLAWMKDTSSYSTFDYRDADRHGLPVIELFSSAAKGAGVKEIAYDVSVIVRNHCERLRYIDQVLSALKPRRVYVSIYELNLFTFAFNFVRSPRLYVKYWRNISFVPVSYDEYSRVMSASEFTIDYAHDTQSGITMRCFEAINQRTKIITNNRYMTRSPHFHVTDYVVHVEGDPHASLVAGYENARECAYASQPRTIAQFIDDLITA